MPNIEAYLEAFHEITILYPDEEKYRHLETFHVKSADETIPLDLASTKTWGDMIKYTLDFKGYIYLNRIYHVHDALGNKIELYSGEVVRSELFDELFHYDGEDLGVTYAKDETTFKLWTPVAKAVNVILFKDDGEETHALSYINQGVWSATISGDLEGTRYLFEARVNGRTNRFNDIYGRASTANGKKNIVIDPDKIKKPKHPRPFKNIHPTDAVIYEASVRDTTVSNTINPSERATFKAFHETGLKTKKHNPAGFDYIKDLGITHVQLLPIYDFEGVDETDRFKAYNWGYNPSQYFIPEGSFTVKPDDPYARINELIAMVDAYHEAGIGVIMDVVYNHIYNIKTFPFDMMIPGYAYRVDHNGVLTNSSGCDSDLATERRMVRKLIVDAVLYWVNTFNIDGFRFDLMGLIDCTTMHVIRQKCEFTDPAILVYGEGWEMSAPLPKNQLCHMNNRRSLFNIGFFNDTVRETIKGETFKLKAKGYAMGEDLGKETARLIRAEYQNKALEYPSQSINYVECHDNHTFYDKARHALKAETEAIRLKAQKLATAMIILMQGVPFIHAGQEFYRTKQGEGNSYRSPDAINQIDWNLVDAHKNDIDAIKQLIAIRKEHDLFRLKTPYEIQNKTYVRQRKTGTLVYELKNDATHLIVLFKNSEKEEAFTFDDAFDIIYQSDGKPRRKNVKSLTLFSISTTILKLNDKA